MLQNSKQRCQQLRRFRNLFVGIQTIILIHHVLRNPSSGFVLPAIDHDRPMQGSGASPAACAPAVADERSLYLRQQPPASDCQFRELQAYLKSHILTVMMLLSAIQDEPHVNLRYGNILVRMQAGNDIFQQ
ncbi:hypothetical protein E2F50_18750 [Rhizobium deserti]|uniref:Uncharacterized protein n=1 Tax=Rhizobium deserti TaxID=2547961 RepID=A0A4R5UA70_9HYPH|nr:hypothetical protein [Rhizobium deserti]TDK31717.1 hypothetical protein E2F50_18750 [Rhizobium deserti]